MRSPPRADHQALQQSYSLHLSDLGLPASSLHIMSASLLSHPQNPLGRSTTTTFLDYAPSSFKTYIIIFLSSAATDNLSASITTTTTNSTKSASQPPPLPPPPPSLPPTPAFDFALVTITDANPFASHPPPSRTSQTHQPSFPTLSVPSIRIPLPLRPDTSQSAPLSAQVASSGGSPFPRYSPRPSSPCPPHGRVPLYRSLCVHFRLYRIGRQCGQSILLKRTPKYCSILLSTRTDLKSALPMDKVREPGAAEAWIKTKESLLTLESGWGGCTRRAVIVLVDPRRAGGFKRLLHFRPFRI